MSNSTAYNRAIQLSQHLCDSKVSVGDALKKQQIEQEQTPVGHNSSGLHQQQTTVSLPSLMFEDAVFVLQSKKTVSLEEWKKSIGSVVGTSEYIHITQDRVDAFAVVTGDPQWIHTRAAKQLGSPFQQPIAHGFLALSLCPYLGAKCMPGITGAKLGVNYGIDKVRFVSPVPVGSHIRAVIKLLDAQAIDTPGTGKGVQNKILITIEAKGSKKPAVTVEWLTRAYF